MPNKERTITASAKVCRRILFLDKACLARLPQSTLFNEIYILIKMRDIFNLIIAFGPQAHSILRLSGFVWRQDVMVLSSKGCIRERKIMVSVPDIFIIPTHFLHQCHSLDGMLGARLSRVYL